jgi:hypothetical protein
MNLHFPSPGHYREKRQIKSGIVINFLASCAWDFFPHKKISPLCPEDQAAHGKADRWLACTKIGNDLQRDEHFRRDKHLPP